jgi:hypothetical protein
MSNTKVLHAIDTLRRFCYSHELCDSCPFKDFREDMGFICYVAKLIDDERFEMALKGSPWVVGNAVIDDDL